MLVRLLNALQTVNIPENVSLELLDCPITHLLESDLSLDESIISSVTSKFSGLAFSTRAMGYAIIKPGTTNLQNRSYSTQRSTIGGLGSQLLKGLSKTSHVKSLRISCEMRDGMIVTPFVCGKQEWLLLRHLELRNFTVDAGIFEEFMNKIIAQLKTLLLSDAALVSREERAWRSIFDSWIAIKNSQPDQWSMEKVQLLGLRNQNFPDLSEPERAEVVQKLAPPA